MIGWRRMHGENYLKDKLTISIDYDDTFTADTETWWKVIQLLQYAGHKVICTSARGESFHNRRQLELDLPGIPILLTNCSPKREYASKAGFNVDIWVDDLPEAIPNKDEMERMCG